ncbi:SixA phosphatase family protein [Flavihumibacter fluvii]|uniref:SixA phosphatase family protein n=1 Tax=Flavihumibacter fluvii TaxID=2838157 RepID=UPI001BDF3E33|nr:histidine phosphatase family protein [Flavihumibacter fluvii]ULQ54487.1 histidine phosphatase family protein [Flavihumibacter fluvii]
MRNWFVLIIISICITGCSQKYFIVRHAEKAQTSATQTMNTPDDPPLTDPGAARADDLSARLANERIRYVFSTNTIRTQSTARPTATRFNLTLNNYGKVDSNFIGILKGLHKNVLIIGHSNTVDDLVNGLTGVQYLSDLPDTAYDNLFIVSRKGKKLHFSQEKFGQPAAQ